MIDLRDTDRLIKFMREEAFDATDARQSWFDATADHLQKQADEIERLRTALRPFVEAYERCGRRESWAASYLNNNAWKAAAEALPTGCPALEKISG